MAELFPSEATEERRWRKKEARWPVRCVICGRFLGAKDFDGNNVGAEFTPDSEFTSEHSEFWHKTCEPGHP